MKLLTRFAGWLTLVAPILIFTFWGATYVFACFDQLLSPGKPLDVSIPTRSGDLRLKADRYSISIWQGALIADKVRIYEADGSLLAGADRLTATMPGSDQQWNGPVNVRVRGLQAVLKRNADRSFPALNYLPESTDEPSTTPFSVEIEGAKLTVEDDADGGLLTGEYRIGSAKVEGLGEQWVAKLDLARSGAAGSILASLRQDPSSALVAEVEFLDAQGADIVGKLAGIEDFKDEEWPRLISAKTLILNGKATLIFPKDGDWTMKSRLDVQARGVAYGKDWQAQEANFLGEVRESGATGQIKAVAGGQPANFDGRADWSGDLQIAGRASARVASLSRLPASLRKDIPAGADFSDASFEGWVGYHAKDGPSLTGEVKAAALQWQDESLRSPRADLGYANGRLVADVRGGSVLGGTTSGILQYEEKTGKLSGELDVSNINLSSVGKKYLDRGMKGTGQVSVLLNGTTDAPLIELRAHGLGSVVIADNRYSPTSNIEFGGMFTEAGLDIRRLKVYYGETAAMLTGQWDAKDGKLSIDGSVRRLQLEDWLENTTGTANAEITIAGTAEKPELSGFAEVYAAKIYDYALPFASSDFVIEKDRVLASDMLLTRGASKVRGEVAYAFESGKLDGTLSGESIQLAEWGPEEISGLVDFDKAKVGGTLEHPRVEGKLLVEALLLHSVPLDSGEATVVLDGKTLDVLSLSIQGDAGAATGKGFYNLETQSGQFEATCDKVVLAEVLPELPEQTQIDGTLRQVQAVATIQDGRISVATAEGTVSALSINRTPLGQGQWSARIDGDDYSASATIGQIDAYIEANNLKYNISTKATSGEVYVKGFPVRDLYRLGRPYVTVQSGQAAPPKFEMPAALIEQLDRFQGTLNAGLILSGTLDSVNIECPDLTLEKMELDGQTAGELATAFVRKDQVWNVEKFTWKGGPGNLTITGTVDEHGEMDLDGEVKNFKPAWLATVLRDFPTIPGEATMSFIATGPTQSPVIHASFDGEIVAERVASAALAGEEAIAAETKTGRAPLGLVLDTIEVEQGSITAQGRLNYGGFQGRIDAKVPFEYPFTIPEDQPIFAKLDFGKRSLTELKELIPSLDEKRTQGEATASLTITGTKADIVVDGSVLVNAKALAIDSMRTYLTDLNASVKIDEDRLQLSATALSSRASSNKSQGSVDVVAVVGLSELTQALSASPDLDSIPVDANVKLANFAVSEDLQERIGGKSEPRLKGSGTVDGEVFVGGTLGNLVIQTNSPLILSNVDGTFISSFEGGAYQEPSPNAPKLGIDFVVGSASKPADVNVSNAVFAMYGQGRIEGTTEQPDARANLTLSSGTIRLPNARVMMDDGGTMRFIYKGGRPDQAETRLDVDLTGRTSLSARSSTGLVERYEIRIAVTGNLLEPEGQRILATSEPADLSQQKILALLGQSQIFENLDPGADSQQLQRQLQEALAGVALPVVFDAVTGELARSLGLDFLNFEYNGYEGAVVAFGKSLGRNLTLQGRRQLQDRPGEIIRYDLSLVYRPFQRRGSFRNVSFTAGMDQDRPYKIGIEYTIRF
ncbi:MAG: translocation/assembly module TamB domain-containing protein [Fimbriimonadaceae bacterium]|nr:translocation/assembly module TamB domain-containing protein [Fimbriimonadaceae bacterium]